MHGPLPGLPLAAQLLCGDRQGRRPIHAVAGETGGETAGAHPWAIIGHEGIMKAWLSRIGRAATPAAIRNDGTTAQNEEALQPI